MSLFDELKRRNVVRVAAAYVVIAWVAAQIAEFAFENFGAPDWVLKSVVILLLLGLPIVVFFAWAFEITPDGVKREEDVDRSQSITTQTGRKLDRTIIILLLVALGWFSWDKFSATPEVAVSADAAEAPVGGSSLGDRSVAVLPFVAMSSGPDDEFFADGLTEEILNSLAQLPELLVTARTSAFSFKGQDIPVQEIAAALGVRHIVEGSVRRSGDRLRVTAQLIRAADGFHLWSENYDSRSTDTIEVQESIAEQIASAMNIVLDERKREKMHKAGLRDVEAFTIYQKAIELYENAHGQSGIILKLQEANKLFEDVIERVPDFPQVYIDHSDLFVHVLSDAAAGIFEPGVTPELIAAALPAAIADYESALRNARNDDSRRFIELDLAFISGEWQGMENRIGRALASNGCHDGNWTPVIVDVFGYSGEFLEYSRKLLACDPRRSLSWFNAARSALKAGKSDEALKLAREGTEIAPGEWLSSMLVRTLIAKGEFAQARTEIDDRLRDNLHKSLFDALLAAAQGDADTLGEALDQIRADETAGYFWTLMPLAWGGYRDEANQMAALIDQHHFGSVTLTQVVQWCGCGSPWDLDATPNFAAKLEKNGLEWSPSRTVEFPLKDW